MTFVRFIYFKFRIFNQKIMKQFVQKFTKQKSELDRTSFKLCKDASRPIGSEGTTQKKAEGSKLKVTWRALDRLKQSQTKALIN
jgi:hypothetical protein